VRLDADTFVANAASVGPDIGVASPAAVHIAQGPGGVRGAGVRGFTWSPTTQLNAAMSPPGAYKAHLAGDVNWIAMADKVRS
jgi:hypothetical protein